LGETLRVIGVLDGNHLADPNSVTGNIGAGISDNNNYGTLTFQNTFPVGSGNYATTPATAATTSSSTRPTPTSCSAPSTSTSSTPTRSRTRPARPRWRCSTSGSTARTTSRRPTPTPAR